MRECKIVISDLRMQGFHGVFDQERIVGSTFVYNIAIDYDFMEAAATDDLTKTINYAEVVDIVKQQNAQPSRLIENVAWRIDRALRDKFCSIGRMTISVNKLNPPISGIDVDYVGVTITTI